MKERDRALGDFDAALKSTQKALEKDAILPAALFNRALILESRQFQTEAADAWRRYLEVDPSSEWAAEARSRLRNPTAPKASLLWEEARPQLQKAATSGQIDTIERLVPALAQQSRLLVEDEILPAWGEALVSGRSEDATRSMNVARRIAAALGRSSGDFLLPDSIAEIDRAFGEPGKVRNLADGYHQYGRGRKLFKSHDIEPAVEVLETSLSSLSQAESVFTGQVRIVLASSRFYQSDFPACEQLLDSIEDDLGSRASRYGSVVAQLDWLRGLVQLSRGHPAESLASYRRVLAAFDRLNETENSAAAHTLLAENFQYLGELDEAVYHRDQALGLPTAWGSRPGCTRRSGRWPTARSSGATFTSPGRATRSSYRSHVSGTPLCSWPMLSFF